MMMNSNGTRGKSRHDCAPPRYVVGSEGPERVLEQDFLHTRYLALQRQAARRQVKHMDAAVSLVGLPVDIAEVDELTQRPMQSLPRHAKNFDQVGGRQRLTASNEIENAVMDAPERQLRQVFVRARDQSAIGIKEQLERGIEVVERHRSCSLAAPFSRACNRIHTLTSASRRGHDGLHPEPFGIVAEDSAETQHGPMAATLPPRRD